MISTELHLLLAQARADDLQRAARASRVAALGGTADASGAVGAGASGAASAAPPSVTLRFGLPDDRGALGQLAALDDALPLSEPVLLAEVAGQLRAALSLADERVVADPFHFTGELVELLRTRAAQLRGGERRGRLRRPWLPLRSGAVTQT